MTNLAAMTAPVLVDDPSRRAGLRRMRTVAASLLVLAAAVYALTIDRDGALGFVNAAAEASMVGAIADWFAVTALFRHPLGIPIPHTALIPNRKRALAASLEEFVGQNFLSADVVRGHVRAAAIPRRIGMWLSEPKHAERVIAEVSHGLGVGLGRVRDEDIEALVDQVLVPRLLNEPFGPVAGQLLEEIVRDDAHRGLVDLAFSEMHRWLESNQDVVARILADRAPWWSPQWVDERVIARLQIELVAWVVDIRDDPDHPVRDALDRLLTDLAHGLQHDEEVMERAERLKQRILSKPAVRDTAVALWDALRRALISALEDPDGMLRTRGHAELTAFASRLSTDEDLQSRFDEYAANTAAYLIDRYGEEITRVISDTVNRWDGKETADRIELYVGRDLQFIRINGTVVGGLVGLLIHTITVLT